MPSFDRGDVSLYYEEHGEGPPLLVFAPGGLRSSIAYWDRAPYHPVREFASDFRVITLDQRNAGRSRAPVSASDSWQSYAADHLALLDHLGIERAHVLGGCIGGAFCLTLAVNAPDRLYSAVLQQPIGYSGTNREVFYELFASWAEELGRTREDLDPRALESFRHNLYDRDFAFSVTPEEVRRIPVPLLVLRGNDVYHPSETSEAIARLAPNAELIPSWKEGEDRLRAIARVRAFLKAHTPA